MKPRRESVESFNKAPNEVLDYGLDLDSWLGDGQAIVSVAAELDPPASTTFTITDVINFGREFAAWVSGGTIGQKVRLILRATTDSTPARVLERSIQLNCIRR